MATVVYIKERTQSKTAMKRVMDYVSQDKKTLYKVGDNTIKLISGKDCCAETAYREFMNTKMKYGKANGTYFYQCVQSFSPEENVPHETAHEIGKRLAEYFKGYEVLIATHVDADHTHNHLIINSVSNVTGMKLQEGPESLFKLRELSDNICKEYGLTVLEPYEKQSDSKSINTREYRVQIKGESWKIELTSAIDKAMALSSSKQEFISAMGEQGYSVKWIDSHKHITYTTPDGIKCRDNKLHDDKYLKEQMKSYFDNPNRIAKQNTEAQPVIMEAVPKSLPKPVGKTIFGIATDETIQLGAAYICEALEKYKLPVGDYKSIERKNFETAIEVLHKSHCKADEINTILNSDNDNAAARTIKSVYDRLLKKEALGIEIPIYKKYWESLFSELGFSRNDMPAYVTQAYACKLNIQSIFKNEVQERVIAAKENKLPFKEEGSNSAWVIEDVIRNKAMEPLIDQYLALCGDKDFIKSKEELYNYFERTVFRAEREIGFSTSKLEAKCLEEAIEKIGKGIYQNNKVLTTEDVNSLKVAVNVLHQANYSANEIVGVLNKNNDEKLSEGIHRLFNIFSENERWGRYSSISKKDWDKLFSDLGFSGKEIPKCITEKFAETIKTQTYIKSEMQELVSYMKELRNLGVTDYICETGVGSADKLLRLSEIINSNEAQPEEKDFLIKNISEDTAERLNEDYKTYKGYLEKIIEKSAKELAIAESIIEKSKVIQMAKEYIQATVCALKELKLSGIEQKNLFTELYKTEKDSDQYVALRKRIIEDVVNAGGVKEHLEKYLRSYSQNEESMEKSKEYVFKSLGFVVSKAAKEMSRPLSILTDQSIISGVDALMACKNISLEIGSEKAERGSDEERKARIFKTAVNLLHQGGYSKEGIGYFLNLNKDIETESRISKIIEQAEEGNRWGSKAVITYSEWKDLFVSLGNDKDTIPQYKTGQDEIRTSIEVMFKKELQAEVRHIRQQQAEGNIDAVENNPLYELSKIIEKPNHLIGEVISSTLSNNMFQTMMSKYKLLSGDDKRSLEYAKAALKRSLKYVTLRAGTEINRISFLLDSQSAQLGAVAIRTAMGNNPEAFHFENFANASAEEVRSFNTAINILRQASIGYEEMRSILNIPNGSLAEKHLMHIIGRLDEEKEWGVSVPVYKNDWYNLFKSLGVDEKSIPRWRTENYEPREKSQEQGAYTNILSKLWSGATSQITMDNKSLQANAEMSRRQSAKLAKNKTASKEDAKKRKDQDWEL